MKIQIVQHYTFMLAAESRLLRVHMILYAGWYTLRAASPHRPPSKPDGRGANKEERQRTGCQCRSYNKGTSQDPGRHIFIDCFKIINLY